MDELLEDLAIGSRVKTIFENFTQEDLNASSNGFSLLLSQISEEFQVEVEGIEYYFSDSSNPLDENDILDPE